jgi:hypothetical protein
MPNKLCYTLITLIKLILGHLISRMYITTFFFFKWQPPFFLVIILTGIFFINFNGQTNFLSQKLAELWIFKCLILVEIVASRQGDAERRITFISWPITEIENSSIILNYILWTDESKFINNGIINKRNNRYWDNQNPHWVIETNNQSVWGTNIWCGLIGDYRDLISTTVN